MNTTQPTILNGTNQHKEEGGSVLTGLNPVVFNPGNPLPLFIIQATLIISLCHLVNVVLKRVNQPRVISEVVAGILLGPSVLGKIPRFHETIFPEPSLPFLNLVSNLGLVLFLFLVGLELDLKLVMQRARRALGISIAGIALPFGLGACLSLLLYKHLEDPEATEVVPIGEFILFCGVAMSVTAFAVLARILADMKLLGTTVGFLSICAGAVGDIVAWILLALVVSIINSASPITPLYVVLLALGWCIILAFVIQPLLMYFVRITHSEEEPSQTMIAITILVVLVSAFVTDIIGIHAIFGGFLVGLFLPHDSGFAEGLTHRLEDLVGVIFLPIYFALSGLKTQIGLLNNGEAWGLVLLVTAFACCGKIIGCSAAALLNGMTWRESLAIGLLMNCKGLVELIVLNIGYDAGVINDKVFVIMVAMCIITTMMATPFVRLVFPIAFQKEIEAKRARELKCHKQEGFDDKDSFIPEDEKMGHLHPGLRQRKGGVNSVAGTADYARSEYSDLESCRLPHADLDDLMSRTTAGELSSESQRRGILFCLDKAANASSVMTLLQLFSRANLPKDLPQSSPPYLQTSPLQQTCQTHSDNPSVNALQPPLDPMDASRDGPSGRHRGSSPRFDTTYSSLPPSPPIFALRMLNISERTTSVVLTASRCLDRLYKDTVMMLVMTFSKLNSIAVQPLVTLSTDVAGANVADDILDQAIEHGAAYIIFPWNSSHLEDLSTYNRRLVTSTDPLISLSPSVKPSNTSSNDPHGQPLPRYRVHSSTSYTSTLEYGLQRGSRHLHRFFRLPHRNDNMEPHKATPGEGMDVFEAGRRHHSNITSNTKVLTKLLQQCPRHHIATGVLVDRGLGHIGGIQNIVVPLFGGKDDEEALLMAAALSSNPMSKCLVTILRVTDQQTALSVYRHRSMTESTHFTRQSIQDSQLPVMRAASDIPLHASDDLTGGWTGSKADVPSKLANDPPAMDIRVPKDDVELLRSFFPIKPRYKGSRPLKRSQHMEGGHAHTEAMETPLKEDDGVLILHFHNIADMALWAKNYLTVQDLMVVGSNASTHLQKTWYSGRMDGALQCPGDSSMNTSLGSNIAGIWNQDGRGSFRFSVDAPTPLYSPPLGSSISILERKAEAMAVPAGMTTETTGITTSESALPTSIPTGITSPPRINLHRHSHHLSYNPPLVSGNSDTADDTPRPSMTLSPSHIHVPADHHRSRTASPPGSPFQPRTSLSSISFHRPSFQSQRTTTQCSQQLNEQHRQLGSLASPLTLRRSLSGKGMSMKGGKSGSNLVFPSTPQLTGPIPVDTSRQMVLGPAVEYFIQFQVQASYLVVRSRHGSKHDSATTSASQLADTLSSVPLIVRSGTECSLGAGIGVGAVGGEEEGRESVARSRSAMEIASPPSQERARNGDNTQ